MTVSALSSHNKITAVKSVITAVTIPVGAAGVWLSNLSALNTVTWDANPVHTKAARVGTFADVGEAGATITIGTRVYTLRAALTAVADEVLIGATATDTATNFKNAINGVSPGVSSSIGTTVNLDVTATSVAGAVTVTARAGGTGGNAIATTETSAAHFSWAGATLTGGANDDTAFGIVIPALGALPVYLPLDRNAPPSVGLFNSSGSTDAAINLNWDIN